MMQDPNEKLITEVLRQKAVQDVPASLDLWPAIQQRLQQTGNPTDDLLTEQKEIKQMQSVSMVNCSRRWILAGLAVAALLALFVIAASVLLNNSGKNDNNNLAGNPTVALPTVPPAPSILAVSTTTVAATTSPAAVATTPACATPLPGGGCISDTFVKTTTSLTLPTARPTTVAPATTQAATKTSGKIVFSNQDQQLFSVNADGSGLTNLGAGFSPILSRDDRQIAFIAKTGRTLPSPEGFELAVYTANLDGTGRKEHCTSSANAQLSLESWSPDGRYIAFIAGQQVARDVFLCDLTLAPAPLTPLKLENIHVINTYDWQATGQILWQSGPAPTDFTLDFYYGDPANGLAGATKLTAGQYRDRYYLSGHLSPDGKTLGAFGTKLFFLAMPGQTSPLAGKTFDNFGPDGYELAWDWSPDSQHVVLADRTDQSLKLLDVATGQTTVLLKNAGTVSAVSWAHK